MEAEVLAVFGGGTMVKLRLWTGEVVTAHRGQLPFRGPVVVGEKLDVAVKPVLVVTDAKRKAASV